MATRQPKPSGPGDTLLQETPAKTKPPSMWQVVLYNDDSQGFSRSTRIDGRKDYANTFLADTAPDMAAALMRRNEAQVREPDRLEAWVFRILTNCWRDTLRARVDMDDVDEIAEALVASDMDPEQHHSRLQTTVCVRAAVAKLPFGQRQVVTLVDLGEFSYAEAAPSRHFSGALDTH